jgi:hypothetical protein
MRWRAFIKLLGVATTMWPLTAAIPEALLVSAAEVIE